jgi:hypothetical protein
VTRHRVLGRCAVALALAASGPRPGAAQFRQPLAERSLLTTDVRDERAVWVNPAGLSRGTQASFAADLTVERGAGDLRLAQYGLALASRRLAFGWEHDRYTTGSVSNAYVVGFGLGDELFSAGVAHRWHQGGQGGWDVGLRGRATDAIDLSVVWRDIGSPVVRGTVIRDSFVPAAGLQLLGGRVLAGVEGELPGDLGAFTEVRAGATIAVASHLIVSCRGTFSREAARRGLAILVGLGGRTYRGALVALLPRGRELGAVGANGAVVADLTGPSRR